MNKKFVFIVIGCVVALAVGIIVYINTNNNYYFKFVKDSASIYLSESFSVDKKSFITNIDDISSFSLSSSDENVFYVENNIVYPVSAGNAILACDLEYKNASYHTQLNIMVLFDDTETVYCERIDLNMPETLYMMTKSQSIIQFDIFPQNANCTITTSDSKIVHIESNNTLIAKQFGHVTIEITAKSGFDKVNQKYNIISKSFDVVVYDVENTEVSLLDLDYKTCFNLHFDNSDSINGYVLFDKFYVDILDVKLTNTFDSSKIAFYNLIEEDNHILLPFKVFDVDNINGSFCVTFLSTEISFTTNQLSFYAYQEFDRLPESLVLEVVYKSSDFISLNAIIYDINGNEIEDNFALKVDFYCDGVTSPAFDFITEVSKAFNNVEINFVSGYSFKVNVYLSYNPSICGSFVIE